MEKSSEKRSSKIEFRILHLEDDQNDAELVQETLLSEGITCDVVRVETRADFFTSLEQGGFNIILADYALPQFDGLSALAMVKEKCPDIPFIFVSGAMGEELAIETLKNGATDYVLKHRLSRLVPAVHRAIIEVEERNKRKQAEEELRKYHEHLEELIEDRTDELKKTNEKLQLEIMERKRSEEALRISEEKFRTVADFTYDWEEWLDPYGKYIYVSPSCEWITGYCSDEFLADPDLVIKITHPDDRDLVEKHFREILSGSISVHNMDFRIIKRSGEERWISHCCQPVYGKDGNFLGRRASNRDISDRKEAEEELKQLTNDLERFNVELLTINDQLKAEIEIRIETEKALKESQERYKSMVSAVTTYTYSVDLSKAGAISTQHSVGCIPVTGHNPEDFKSDPYLWHKMIYPDDRMIVENSIKEILDGREVPPIEHRIIRRDGKVVWVRNTMVTHYDVGRRLIRYDSLIEDITERKQAEEEIQKLNRVLQQKITELTEANKELDAFNYSVSHDLQTPLTVAGGFVLRLLKNFGDKLDTSAKDMLHIILMHVQKAERLIKDLLAFSRSGRQQIKAIDIDIGNLVITVLDELKALTNGRKIQFDIKPLPQAYGDLALIKQVFVNLLSNAIKFTSSKDTAFVEVGYKVEENETIYYVKDNGIGFYPQHVNELFSPFQRLSGAKEYEGTGVGLSIVQRIVNRHGGRVWAEGKVNEGATFYFSLSNKSLRNS